MQRSDPAAARFACVPIIRNAARYLKPQSDTSPPAATVPVPATANPGSPAPHAKAPAMSPETSTLLLRVAQTWPLPGLGLLALPDGPTPYLAAGSLHTALAVEVRLPDGSRHPGGLATVEEVSRPDDAAGPTCGLLLDLRSTRGLPVCTTIWLAEPAPDSE